MNDIIEEIIHGGAQYNLYSSMLGTKRSKENEGRKMNVNVQVGITKAC